MKKSIVVLFGVISVLAFGSCKKCQTCTTTTSQVVNGINVSTDVSEDYCGNEYESAPAEGTVYQNVGGITQTVTIDCVDK